MAEELIEKESEEAPTGAAAPVPVRPEDKLPYDANLARDKFKVQNILRGGQLAPADEATFDKYYTGYAIARWTQPDLRVQLHRFRQEMRNDLQLAKEPVHGRLVAFALNAMKEFTRPDKNYHPAVQANAMLMIAELNEVERTAQTDAVPSPAALDVMLEVVDAAKGAKYSEGVKVAALVGIRRHAEARGDSIPKVAEVSKAMLAILAAKAPIDRPADGFHWMQGQACEILGLIGQPGDKNIVVRALAYIVRTQSIPAGTRTAAARSLGRIKFANATGLIASDLAATVAQFVVDACDNELVIYENYEPVYRRRIKAALQGALIGLNGVTPELKGISGLANTPQEQEYVKDIVSKIDELITTLDDEELYEEEVVEGIKKASEEISGLIDQKPGN